MSPPPSPDSVLTPELIEAVQKLRDDMERAGPPFTPITMAIVDTVVAAVSTHVPPQHQRTLMRFIATYLALLSRVPE